MPQAKQQVELNNFSGGYNTEQSPLNADPSTTIQEQNMVLASDGSRARRYGLQLDESAVTTHFRPDAPFGTPYDVSVINAFNIKHASDATNKFTLLTRNRSDLIDFPTMAGFEQEGAILNNPVTLGYPASRDYEGIDYNMGYTSLCNSVLMPSGSGARAISYTPSGIINLDETSRLYFRDIWGVDDGLAIDERPLAASLDANHAYNLYNQGWTPDALIKFNTEIGALPSNADAPYFGIIKDTTGSVYDPEILKIPPFLTGAPKGRWYLDAYGPGGSRRDSLIQDFFDELNTAFTLTLTTIDINIVTPGANSWWNVNSVASFMGRAFYTGNLTQSTTGYYPGNSSGDKVPPLTGAVFFSRVADTTSAPGFPITNSFSDRSPFMCASILDPTSENFAPAATDGGFLFVDGAEKILGCFALRDSLLIVASNGVWELRAQDGFSPSTFILSKVAEITIESVNPITRSKDFLAIPAKEGIFFLYYDGESRRTVSTNISDEKIRTFYNAKRKWFFASAYDEANSEIRWLLHTPPETQETGKLVVVEQQELVYDTRLGSFSFNVFPDCQVEVVPNSRRFGRKPVYGCESETRLSQGYYITNYLVVGDDFSLGEETTAIDAKRNRISLRYVVVEPGNYNIGIATPEIGVFEDFYTDVPAYIVTNPMTMGDTIRRKDINYLWTHFYRSEDGFEDVGGEWVPTNESSCLMSARWDFSDSATSGKWTTPRQVYRLTRDYLPENVSDDFDYGQNIITTKNNLPGSGKALSVKFESEYGKDFQLIGWGAEVGITGAV